MQQDPFGNLSDWESVLDYLDSLQANGRLSKCQPELVRILRYKGNWRLREGVLKRVGEIEHPSSQLVHQVLTILDDDNAYYDVRILAGETLIRLLKNTRGSFSGETKLCVRKVAERLTMIPQPVFFHNALKDLDVALSF